MDHLPAVLADVVEASIVQIDLHRTLSLYLCFAMVRNFSTKKMLKLDMLSLRQKCLPSTQRYIGFAGSPRNSARFFRSNGYPFEEFLFKLVKFCSSGYSKREPIGNAVRTARIEIFTMNINELSLGLALHCFLNGLLMRWSNEGS
jgi:hypothetical protein